MQEAMKRIEKLGLKIPGQGAGNTQNSASGPASDLPIPPQGKPGISMQEAMDRIKGLGVKVPSPIPGGAAQNTDPWPPASQGASVSQAGDAGLEMGATASAAEPSEMPQSPSDGDSEDPDQFGNSVTADSDQTGVANPKQTTAGFETAASRSPTVQDNVHPQAGSADSTEPWMALAGKPVRITFRDGRFRNGFLKSATRQELLLTTTPDDPKSPANIHYTAVADIEPLKDGLTLYLDSRVRITLNSGLTKKGFLKRLSQNTLYLEKWIFGGSFTFRVSRSDVANIRLLP